MRDVCADFETELAEFNGQPNHARLLVNFPPKATLSKLASSLKGVSSRRMRQEFPTCAATTGGRTGCGPVRTSPGRSRAPISALRQYIERQNRPG
jgi:putative transposase